MERKSVIKKVCEWLHCTGYVLKRQSIRCRQECLLPLYSRVLIVVASRLFVLPYYGRIALVGAVLLLIATMFSLFTNGFKNDEAVRQLDELYAG